MRYASRQKRFLAFQCGTWISAVIIASIFALNDVSAGQSPEPNIAVWLHALQSSARVRHAAALDIRSLNLQQSREANQYLAERLADGTPFVQAAIANAFGESGAYAEITVPALIALLRNCKEDVCLHASMALVKLGDPAVHPLVGELKSALKVMEETSFKNIRNSYSTRIGTVRYILQSSTSALVDDELIAWMKERSSGSPLTSAKRPWRCSAEFRRSDINDLDCNKFWPERLITAILKSHFDRITTKLIALLRDDDVSIQSLALESVPSNHNLSRSMVDALLPFAFSDDDEISGDAIFHIGQSPDVSQDALIAVASKHQRQESRSEAIGMLPLSQTSMQFLFLTLANDPSPKVRIAIANQLIKYDKEALHSSSGKTVPALLKLLNESDADQQGKLWDLIGLLLDKGWETDSNLTTLLEPAAMDALRLRKRYVLFFDGFSRVTVGLQHSSPDIAPLLLTAAKASLAENDYWEFAGALVPILSQVESISPEDIGSIFDLALRGSPPEETKYLLSAMPSFPRARERLLSILDNGVLDRLRVQLLTSSESERTRNDFETSKAFVSGLLALVDMKSYSDTEAIKIVEASFANRHQMRALCPAQGIDGYFDEQFKAGKHDGLKRLLLDRCRLAQKQTAEDAHELKRTIRSFGDTPEAKQFFREANFHAPGMTDFLTELAFDRTSRFHEAAADALARLVADDPRELGRLFFKLSRSKLDTKLSETILWPLSVGRPDHNALNINRTGRLAFISLLRRLPRQQIESFAFLMLENGNFASGEIAPFLSDYLKHGEMQGLELLKSRPDYAKSVLPSLRELLFSTSLTIRSAAAEVLLFGGVSKDDFEFAASAAGEANQAKYLSWAVDEERHEIEGYLGYPTSLHVVAELPPFPWPPPAYAHIGVFGRDVPRQDLGSDDQSLEHIYQRIYATLKATDVNFEGGLFGVPGGFAFLSRLEQINPDGTPLPGLLHFYQGRVGPKNLSEYLADLIMGRPGYFRMLAFVITDQSNFGSSTASLPDYRSGATVLPDELGAEPFGSKNGFILVYSFERVLGGSVRPYDLLSAARHLQAAGILGKLEEH